jgi:hypothetical protein
MTGANAGFLRSCLTVLQLGILMGIASTETARAEISCIDILSSTPSAPAVFNRGYDSEVVGSYADVYGGTIYIRRKTRAFSSDEGKRLETPHIWDLVSEQPGFFALLGLKIVGSDLHYPDGQALSSRLKKLGKPFASKLRFGFVPGSSKVSAKDYIAAWAMGIWIYSLPSVNTADGAVHFHDLGAHWGIVLIPDEILERSQRYAQFLVRLRERTSPILHFGLFQKLKAKEKAFANIMDLSTGAAGETLIDSAKEIENSYSGDRMDKIAWLGRGVETRAGQMQRNFPDLNWGIELRSFSPAEQRIIQEVSAEFPQLPKLNEFGSLGEVVDQLKPLLN